MATEPGALGMQEMHLLGVEPGLPWKTQQRGVDTQPRGRAGDLADLLGRDGGQHGH